MEEYVCLKCEEEFTFFPGPVICPKCHHIYCKWKSYDEKKFFPDRFKEDQKND